MQNLNFQRSLFCGILALLLGCWAGFTVHGADLIWVEGESATVKEVTRHPWWYDKVKHDELSGGDFISHWNDKQPGEVGYDLKIPADKDYHFWVRANNVGTKLSYKLDTGDWVAIETEKNPVDARNIAEDEKPDLRFLSWIQVGTLKLAPGAHKLRFKFHSANNNHGMLDCFVLSADVFIPNGKLKPGEKEKINVVSEEGRWAFAPEKDTFAADAVLDLRYLNEGVAGESGFVKKSPDGMGFVLGNGKPVRFWAVGDDASNGHAVHGKPDLARNARFLAKHGVNLTRCFADITPDKSLDQIDTGTRDRLWRHVAAMKKEGIYTLFTPIWIGACKLKPSMGYLDDGGNQNWGLLFIDKKLQEAYKGWMKQTLSEKNPYTGIPLADDPSLAFIQIQNEDSLLFYTQQTMKGAAKKEYRRLFGEFAKTKYGSFDNVKDAWGGTAPGADQDAPDDFEKGEAAIAGAWELTQHRFGDKFQQRISDQMEFTCKLMRDFNKNISDYLKNELHCKCLINAGNWRTADNVTQLDGERWAQSANEVMAVNRYYGGIHEGQNAGWAICNGDKFTDDCCMLKPRALPVTLKQVDGYPIMITESTWNPPQGYQSEGPFLVAAYSSLGGIGPYFWFVMGEETWAEWTINTSNGYMPSQGKWICNTPMLLGQWPAAALLYRQGYVKKGDPAVYEERSLDDIFTRRMPIIAEDEGYDPFRDKGLVAKESNIKDGVDPLAYLVGPVIAKYGGDASKSKVVDLKKYIDPAKKLVKSDTSELELDYGTGLCKVDAPKAQGATGFLKKTGKITLSTLSIDANNDYATVLAVPLDDQPLASSEKVLLQVGTSERSTGWATKPAKVGGRDGEEIVSFGKAPWQIVKADMTISLKNPKLKKAYVLDPNGMISKNIEITTDTNGVVSLKFPEDALYVVLQSK
jgi:hypothetical protein